MFSRGPSPSGRGCREAAGEAKDRPSSGPSGHLLPQGEGLAQSFRRIWTGLIIDRPDRITPWVSLLFSNPECRKIAPPCIQLSQTLQRRATRVPLRLNRRRSLRSSEARSFASRSAPSECESLQELLRLPWSRRLRAHRRRWACLCFPVSFSVRE